MSIERAEKLKDLLTDKFVVVDADVPELKRFQNWTGKVRTVNMNCRALVEFDGPVDIGWYDIDPDYLKVVDAPVKKTPAHAAKAAPTESKAETKPAAKPAVTAGKSPLDAIRAQQAAKAGSSGVAPAGGAKQSPLDMIRKQQAAKAAAAGTTQPEATASAAAPAPTPIAEPAPPPPAASTPPAAVPKPAPTTGPDGKPLSKLDMIRMQGGAKR